MTEDTSDGSFSMLVIVVDRGGQEAISSVSKAHIKVRKFTEVHW
jgi:hypothetical protein